MSNSKITYPSRDSKYRHEQYLLKYKSQSREYQAKRRLDPEYREQQRVARRKYMSSSAAKIRYAEFKKVYLKRKFSEWTEYFPEITACQCCGQLISFLQRPDMGQIHFDHRQGGVEPIIQSPRHWLRNKSCTPENIAIWESCDFGFLCLKCNSRLPTKNRVEFLKNALKYAEGITDAC